MKCPDCGSEDITLDYEKGENFCNECGLIIEDLLPEKHEVLPEGRISHSPGSIKAGGFMPDGAIVKASWMLSSKEKNVMKARKSINFIASKMNLPKYIVSDAFRLYKEAIYRDLSVGRDNASLKYACLYAACKMCEMPKTPKELIEYATQTKKKDLLKAYKLMKDKLGLKIRPSDPVDYAHRYAAQLDVSPKTITKIMELVEKIKKTNLFTGRHPESVIAAAIYLGCKLNNEPKTQREISAVVGVIEITIRKHYKEIEEKLGLTN
ncbi:transcription initiation factor IIB family protein [Candidatus Woesearchaeota archaeon]|nr:transcription initiation factor IIB family protein [Candidatus Woesearchaeota archaeon]